MESIEIWKGKEAKLITGNIDIKRDFSFALKFVEAFWLSLQQETSDNYIICSG